MHAEWRIALRPPSRRELTGNVVSIIPAGQPHSTFWKRRASLVHVYFHKDFLKAAALNVVNQDDFALRTAHLVRDPFVEELGRALYRECQTGILREEFADSIATLLATHLLRTYNANP